MARRKQPDNPFAVQRLVESERRAGVDLAWIVVAAIMLCVVAIAFTVPDALLRRIEDIERLDINGVLALLVVVPLGATAFAVRRYRDAIGAQKDLQHLSLHDSLTELPNRRHLREVLPSALVHATRNNTRAAVLFIDLDGFKGVNDTYGHEVGDHLMVAVGRRLVRATAEGRWVARYAGDEFVVVDPAPPTVDHARQLATELVAMIEQPFEIGEDRISISASIGIAFADVTVDPEVTLRDADAAMYAAKGTPERAVVFDESMRATLTTATAEARLAEALERGEFQLLYQPIVALRSGQLIGAEALLRWDDPERGVLGPNDFLPALEESGLIVPVGRWVMREALRQAAQWSRIAPAGHPPLRITLNASPRQLAQVDFVDDVRQAIELSGVDPRIVYLELTEAALINEPRATWASVARVRELGVGLALDDFGTGYSSLNHLRSFDLELLKLDASFLRHLGRDGKDDTIVRHVFALARSLGIATLAEGVSEAHQIAALVELGCELGQGFHFAEPQPASVVEQLIVNGQHGAHTSPPPAAAPTPVLPSLRSAT
ncbi:MAG: bifunctional diguanylate cyclase/phosphodiesterase [Actinomycetota bacterium]